MNEAGEGNALSTVQLSEHLYAIRVARQPCHLFLAKNPFPRLWRAMDGATIANAEASPRFRLVGVYTFSAEVQDIRDDIAAVLAAWTD